MGRVVLAIVGGVAGFFLGALLVVVISGVGESRDPGAGFGAAMAVYLVGGPLGAGLGAWLGFRLGAGMDDRRDARRFAWVAEDQRGDPKPPDDGPES